MTKENNSMDNFLRDSLGNMEIEPTRSVWKGISKRLIIFELLRLNFTNVSKSWIYSGLAVVATVAGISYFGLQEESLPTVDRSPLSKTEQTSTIESESLKSLETQTKQISGTSTQNTSTTSSEMISESEILVSNPNASEIVSDPLANEPSSATITNSIDKQDHNSTRLSAPTELNNYNTSPEMALLLKESESAPEYLEMKTAELFLEDKIFTWPPLDSSQLLSQEDSSNAIDASETRNMEWFVSANYRPEWPISNEDIYVNNHQLSVKAGFQYEKMSFSLGLGLKTENTPSTYNSYYSSYDSVGYFYDIDYFEEHPFIEDSIIIYYTIRNIYDSINHQSEMNGPGQRRRWVFIPVEIGYQILSKPKYELTGKLAATFGWEVYTENPNLSNTFPANYSIEDITPQTQSYVQIGIGLENSFSIMPQWWIYAEPRINYYTKSPYRLEGVRHTGPFSFGLQMGVKYKFKGRR